MKTKICGLKYEDNIKQVAELKPDFMGFIFYKESKRYVGEKFNASILNQLDKDIKKVGVFVNENSSTILDIVARYNLDLVQLHGTESQEDCEEIKKNVQVIKAFQIDSNFDSSILLTYENCTDYFLFDTKTKGHGGSGIKFDWSLLKNYKINKPYFLSGGIETSDIPSLKEFAPFAIDVNSKFEDKPGLKNIQKLNELLSKTKEYAI